jgi:hypothetical protein
MSTGPPREAGPPAPRNPAPDVPDPTALRQRLATLLGRLLARHWLRARKPPTPDADPEAPASPEEC